MDPIELGPLIFPAGLLALVVGLAVATMVGAFLVRRGHARVEAMLYLVLGLGLLGARVAYVARWWPAYGEQPWSVLNIRDGGFSLWAGLLAGVLAAVVVALRRPALRQTLAASAIAGVAAAGFAVATMQQLSAASSAPLPALTLTKLEGGDIALPDLRGKPTVINLWATWCPPCRREMPVLAAAQKTLPGVRFIFADQGESAGEVRTFLQARGLTLDGVLIDEASNVSRYYNARGFPTTLFIDANGVLRDMHVGELSQGSLAERLSRIAPEPVGEPGTPLTARPGH
jgi:thiol-disulfide isomerase/thioredoxin